MSEPLRSVHVRLSSECHDRIQIMADLSGKTIAELAEALIDEAVMGRFHAVKVSAERIVRLGIVGLPGQGKG